MPVLRMSLGFTTIEALCWLEFSCCGKTQCGWKYYFHSNMLFNIIYSQMCVISTEMHRLHNSQPLIWHHLCACPQTQTVCIWRHAPVPRQIVGGSAVSELACLGLPAYKCIGNTCAFWTGKTWPSHGCTPKYISANEAFTQRMCICQHCLS